MSNKYDLSQSALYSFLANSISRRDVLKYGGSTFLATLLGSGLSLASQSPAHAAEGIQVHFTDQTALYVVNGQSARPELSITTPTATQGKVEWQLFIRDNTTQIQQGSYNFQANANATFTVPISDLNPDYYRVQVKITDTTGATLTETSLGLGVLRPAAQGLRPESPFGLGFRMEGNPIINKIIGQKLGVKWVRGGIEATDPPIVGPAPGVFWGQDKINEARQQVKEWNDYGIQCLGFVNYNMEWNVTPGPNGEELARHQNRPRDMAAHVEMVYHMISPLQDLVKNWEIWNEPWIHSWTWATGEAQDYRNMAKMIWDRVKPEFPDVNIIGGGSITYNRDIVYAKDSKDIGYIDGSVSHAYGFPDGSQLAWTYIQAEMDKRWSRSHGRGGLWQTELGTATFMFSDLPEQERLYGVARTVAPTHLLHMFGAGDVPIHVFWFALAYDSGYSGDEFNMYNTSTRTPHPVVIAYSAMTHFLEGNKLVGELYPDAKSTWAFLFERPDNKATAALYADQLYTTSYSNQEVGYTGKVTLKDAAGIAIYDHFGHQLFDGKQKEVTLDIKPWEVLYLVSNHNVNKLKAILKHQTIFSYNRPLAINPLSFIKPIQDKTCIEVLVENVTPHPVDANLHIQAPAGWTLDTTAHKLKHLQSGEKQVVRFTTKTSTANADNRYLIKYQADVTLPQGQTLSTQKGEQVIQVAYAPYKTISVDGNLSDWQGVIPTTITSGSTTYKTYTAWDDSYFYFAAQVPDDSQASNKPFEQDLYAFPFWADCIQLGFNLIEKNPEDFTISHSHHEKSMQASMDHLYIATLAQDNIPELHRQATPGTNYQTFYPTNGDLHPPLGTMDVTPTGGTEGKIQIVRDDTQKLTTYEIAIAWSQLTPLQKRLSKLRKSSGDAHNPTIDSHTSNVEEVKFAFAINDTAKGTAFWTREAGLVQSGSYNFAPFWGTGSQEAGGRIITRWGFGH